MYSWQNEKMGGNIVTLFKWNVCWKILIDSSMINRLYIIILKDVLFKINILCTVDYYILITYVQNWI